MDFYDKVVLSGSPSAGSAIALVVHAEGKRLSFTRVGEPSSWRQVSIIERGDDSFADIVHHRGRFYTLTMKGILVSLKFYRLNKPKRMMIISKDDKSLRVITRYLVSTPWADLLQVCVVLDRDQENGVKVDIDKLDLKSRRLVQLTPTDALQGHTAFLGQNSPVVLSTKKFPELRPDCIYFTTPRLRNKISYGNHYNQWRDVKVYDLKTQMLESAFPWRGRNYERAFIPLDIWFTPSHLPY
jgi:hypothetical protein